jgi:hypothetical protein
VSCECSQSGKIRMSQPRLEHAGVRNVTCLKHRNQLRFSAQYVKILIHLCLHKRKHDRHKTQKRSRL